jgi:ribosomal protein S18 acetylase RimI-like enzyme
MHGYEYTLNKSKLIDIYSHLRSCDNSFIPPLHLKVDINEYSLKLEKLATRFEAWHNHELIGLVAAYLNEPKREVAFITNVSVDKRHAAKGIAKKLLMMCIENSDENKFHSVELEVFENNKIATGLYDKLGFTFLEKGPDDTIKLALQLT